MTASINGTTGVTFPDASVQGTAATGFGFKNRIINGAMMIDQRNAGASVTPTGNVTTVDRWNIVIGQASKLTFQQSTTAPAGFKNSLLTTVAAAVASPAAGDQFLYRQMIEGLNVPDLGWGTGNAQPVTISFWVRSSVTGSFPVALMNDGYNRSYVATYTISAANTWEQKSVTVSGDVTGTWLTDNTTGIRLVFALGTGSNRTTSNANTWQSGEYCSVSGCTNLLATNGATFYITGVQLEKGSTATSFDYRPYGTELALCQRYYEILGGGAVQSIFVDVNAASSAFTATTSMKFSVEKRAIPTMASFGTFTTSNTTGSFAYASDSRNVAIWQGASAAGRAYWYNQTPAGFTASSEL